MVWRYEKYETEIMPLIFIQYPIAPPFKNLIIRKSNLSSFLSHHITEKPDIDELYHENSKLSPFINSFLSMQNHLSNFTHLLDNGKGKSIEAFYENNGIYKSIKGLKEPFRSILFSTKNLLSIFYGFYCFLYENRILFKFERPEHLIFLKEIQFEPDKFFNKNLFVFTSQELKSLELKNPILLIFLYLNHYLARSVFGVRGYRMTLIECGKIIKMAENEIEKLGLDPISTSLFYDNSLNRFLGLDGRNFSVQGVIVVEKKK